MTESTANFHGMKTFFVIWFGQLISTLGSGLTGFALGVWIYQETGSASLFAMNVLAFTLPGVLIGPFAGALVDRWNRRLVLIAADALAGLSTLVVWYLLSSDLLEVWHIYVLTALNSVGNTFQFPAYSASITMLVPREQFGRASGMVQIGDSISQLISPAAAGVLFVTIGIPGIILIDFITFGFAVLSLVLIRIPQPKRTQPEGENKPSLLQDVRFGLGFITARKGLLVALLYIAVINFALGMQFPMMMPMLLELGSPDQAGLVTSAIGLGMVVGSIVMSIWGGPKQRVYGIVGSGMVVGIAQVVLGSRPSFLLIGIAGFLSMFAFPIGSGSSRALWQNKTPPDIQGRVFAVRRVIAQFTFPIAVIISGALVDNVLQPLMNADGLLADSVGRIIGVGPGRGIGLMFVLLGLMMFSASVITLANPRFRNVQEEIPDVEIVAEEESPVVAEEAVATA